jgi:hypothetical protein
LSAAVAISRRRAQILIRSVDGPISVRKNEPQISIRGPSRKGKSACGALCACARVPALVVRIRSFLVEIVGRSRSRSRERAQRFGAQASDLSRKAGQYRLAKHPREKR